MSFDDLLALRFNAGSCGRSMRRAYDKTRGFGRGGHHAQQELEDEDANTHFTRVRWSTSAYVVLMCCIDWVLGVGGQRGHRHLHHATGNS